MVTSKAFVYDPVLILYTVKSCVLGRDHNVNSTGTLHTRFKMEADDTNVVKSDVKSVGVRMVAGDFVTKHLRNQTRSYPTDFVNTFSYPK